jgi:hypothetical protein
MRKVFAVLTVNEAADCLLEARECAGVSGASLARRHWVMSTETLARLTLELAAETDHGCDRLADLDGR